MQEVSGCAGSGSASHLFFNSSKKQNNMKCLCTVRLLTALLLFSSLASKAQVKTKIFTEGVPFKFDKA